MGFTQIFSVKTIPRPKKEKWNPKE